MALRNKILITLIFIAFGLFCFVMISNADTILDIEADTTTYAEDVMGKFENANDEDEVGLIYLAQTTGEICNITLPIKKTGTPTDDIKFTIYNSDRSQTLGTSNTISGSDITTSYASRTFTFDECVGINTNWTYRIELSRSTASTSTDYYNIWRYNGDYSNYTWWYAEYLGYGFLTADDHELVLTINGEGILNYTHIEWDNPQDEEATASQSIDFQLTYYFNSATHASSSFNKLLIMACSLIDVSPFNQNLNTCEKIIMEDQISYDELITVGKTESLKTNGAYLLVAEFWNGVSSNSNCSWWEISCTDERVQVLTPNAINIQVATSAIGWDSMINAIGSNYDATMILCGADDAEWYQVDDLLAGYICKVLVFLFYPDSTLGGANNQLNQLKDNLNDKLPFALFFAPYSKLTDLSNATASTSFATFYMPIAGKATLSFDFKSFKDSSTGDFLDVIAVPINYFMWFWFALYIFKDLAGNNSKDD